MYSKTNAKVELVPDNNSIILSDCVAAKLTDITDAVENYAMVSSYATRAT